MQTNTQAMDQRSATMPASANAANAADAGTSDQQGETAPDAETSPGGDQELYNKVMTGVMSMLYSDDNTHKAIVTKLRDEAQNLPFAIGHTAAMVIKSVIGNAEKSGVTISDDVALHAGTECVAELCDIALAMNLVQKDGEDDLFGKAVVEGVRAFGQALQNEGSVTPEMQAAAKATLVANGGGAALAGSPAAGGAQGNASAPSGIVSSAMNAGDNGEG